MGKKLKFKKSDNPLDAIKSVVKTEVKKTGKVKQENIMPLTEDQENLVKRCVKAQVEFKKAEADYKVLAAEVLEEASTYLETESFKVKKNYGSFFMQVEEEDKRVQIVPVDKFSAVNPENLEDIQEVLDDKYEEIIEKTTTISVKTEIVEDKEKLAKLVKIIQANPELADMLSITESNAVVKGGLDLTYQLDPAKREELLTLVKLTNPGVKVVNKK